MELEALESIFDQDFRRLSDASFEVALRPYASDDTEESHGGARRSSMLAVDSGL